MITRLSTGEFWNQDPILSVSRILTKSKYSAKRKSLNPHLRKSLNFSSGNCPLKCTPRKYKTKGHPNVNPPYKTFLFSCYRQSSICNEDGIFAVCVLSTRLGSTPKSINIEIWIYPYLYIDAISIKTSSVLYILLDIIQQMMWLLLSLLISGWVRPVPWKTFKNNQCNKNKWWQEKGQSVRCSLFKSTLIPSLALNLE